MRGDLQKIGSYCSQCQDWDISPPSLRTQPAVRLFVYQNALAFMRTMSFNLAEFGILLSLFLSMMLVLGQSVTAGKSRSPVIICAMFSCAFNKRGPHTVCDTVIG